MSWFEPTIPLSFHDASMAAWQTRYDALLDKYQSLKLAGAVEVPTPLPGYPDAIVSRIQLPTDEMHDLIAAKAGSNIPMRKQMLRQLAQDRASGVDDDTLRQAILNGVTSDGVPS